MVQATRRISVAVLLIAGTFAAYCAADTPFAANGRLKVVGKNLCASNGQPIQLRGMSTHGLQWFGWGDCLNASSLDALANEWGADIVRVAMYVQEGGYETNEPGFRNMVDTIVDEVKKRGMYCIIDWHTLTPGDPWSSIDKAKEFFGYMSQKHGSKGHVLYEICNEPNGVDWNRIKSYAEQVIPVIRANDPDGVIIVGTPDWSSLGVSGLNEGAVESSPLSGSIAHNLMYTFHFYASSHGQEYRDALSSAADKLPVFVTEWGSQTYTGDGENDFNSSQKYIDLMRQKKISWTNWNYSDDHRSGAVFAPGTCPGGPWSGNNLKEAGTWVQDKILNPPDDFATTVSALPSHAARAGLGAHVEGSTLIYTLSRPGKIRVSVFSLDGREAATRYSGHKGAGVERVNLGGFSRGVYLAEVATDAGAVTVPFCLSAR